MMPPLVVIYIFKMVQNTGFMSYLSGYSNYANKKSTFSGFCG